MRSGRLLALSTNRHSSWMSRKSWFRLAFSSFVFACVQRRFAQADSQPCGSQPARVDPPVHTTDQGISNITTGGTVLRVLPTVRHQLGRQHAGAWGTSVTCVSSPREKSNTSSLSNFKMTCAHYYRWLVPPQMLINSMIGTPTHAACLERVSWRFGLLGLKGAES